MTQVESKYKCFILNSILFLKCTGKYLVVRNTWLSEIHVQYMFRGTIPVPPWTTGRLFSITELQNLALLVVIFGQIPCLNHIER